MGLTVARADKPGYVIQLVVFALLLLVVTETRAPSAKEKQAASTQKVATNILETHINYRLPRHVVPKFYEIKLRPNLTSPGNFTFRGHVKIQFTCKKRTRKITLHASGLDIDRRSIKLTPDEYKYDGYGEDKKKEFFTIRLNQHLEAKKDYWISINYTAPLKSEPVGLYYSKYQKNGETRYLVRTKFEPTYARRAFPCFDEPAMKADFQVDLVKPAGTTTLSNALIKNNDNKFEENGTVYITDSYLNKRCLSTYLVAFTFLDFEVRRTDKKNNKSRIIMWTSPKLVEKSAPNLELGMKLFEHFKHHFVYESKTKKMHKLQMAAVPGQDRRVSHDKELITFREADLLGHEPNEALRYRTETTLARAIAHQFIGNKITPKWWDDIWISEGMASFLEQWAIAALNKDVGMNEFFIIEKLQPAFALDGSVHSRPLHTHVASPEAIKILFGRIAVSKGAAVFRMIQTFMGEELFHKAISNYVIKIDGKITSRAVFYKYLYAHVENLTINVEEAIDTWVVQPNYPVVMVARDVNNHSCIQATQQRFLDDDAADDDDQFKSEFNYRWSIPLSFFSSENVHTLKDKKTLGIYCLHNNEYTKRFTIEEPLPASDNKDGWILANYNQFGFYRVNYPTGNWLALSRQLNTHHTVIPVIHRAQIINDAWNLAKAGYVELNTAFAVVEYLSKEDIYLPWFTAMKEFKYVAAMLENTAQAEPFRVYVQTKLKGPYDAFRLKVEKTYLRQLMQSLAVLEGCTFGIDSCNSETSKQFQAWMSNGGQYNISQNLRTAVYCRGVANEQDDQQKNWHFVLKKYSETDDEVEKENLLFALSCSDNKTHMDVIGAEMLKNDAIFSESSAFKLLTLMINKPAYKDAGWNFYYKNYRQLLATFQSFDCKYALPDLTQNFNTDADLTAVTTFMKKHCEDYHENTYTREIIDNIKKNIRWRNKNLPHIGNFLKINKQSISVIGVIQ
ncbi:hypothetical protein BsWGS_03967 [Bradybaena similaris]